ncbi:MAG: arginine--tRNA ligase [Thermoflexibacter sp.]
MNIELDIAQLIAKGIQETYHQEIAPEELTIQPTKKEFEGDFTLVTFALTKSLKRKPEEIGEALGEYAKNNSKFIANYNVIKGFLNLKLSESFWLQTLASISNTKDFGQAPFHGTKVMVEYSSPNTNKPLHLGHLRNNFLGYSVAEILKASGYEVMRTNLVNDRGIHICKSMLAYKKFGHGETPQSAGIKGDHLVGNYYVIFDKENKKQIEQLLTHYQSENPNEDIEKLKEKAGKNTPLILEAQEMLRKWEEGDKETVNLWKQMNGWVYEGFEATYKMMGVSFDKIYYESNTYLLGKNVVEEGLAKGIFFKKENGSVWIDLKEEGLDEKLVLRADGTSVYITQDLGTADYKYADFPMEKSIYVVGNEQDYHFKVLFTILKKLGRSYANGMYHLSYGMVELPSGKMKSREGTVVDADDLIEEMISIAETRTKELGKIDDFSAEEAKNLYRMLALGALKYYLLRVDPKKTMLFNPEESIDFQGDTGVYIQYIHARICSLLRRAEVLNIDYNLANAQQAIKLHQVEIELIKLIASLPKKIKEAAEEYAPSVMADFAYTLAKAYSKFYNELSVFNEPDEATKSMRLALSAETAKAIKTAMGLIGVEVPERM